MVLDKQHCKIHNEQVAELRQNLILVKSIRHLKSSRPHRNCISLTDSHGFIPKILLYTLFQAMLSLGLFN